MYSDLELKEILGRLRSMEYENEVVEFKEAKNQYDFRKLGKYFSALSNEANLRKSREAWLIFGVSDKERALVDSRFRLNSKNLHHLKREIADKNSNRISFKEIYELIVDGKRVVMFCIPPAPKAIPVAFEGHYYARDHESLVPLNIEKIERIRSQQVREDWSAGIVEEATFDDLDKDAIAFAREKYKGKFQSKAEEVEEWDDVTFLNKAKILRKGKVTRTAILLLGNSNAEHFLLPSECKIRWLLRNNQGDQLDYELFTCPLILAVDRVFRKIRNLKYRYLKEGTLFPEEVDQYTAYTIREAINNCIGHQDYTMGGRINVVEYDDYLVFRNKGEFIPGSIEEVVTNNAPEETYRNPFLANAMFNVGMVDTAGGGIRKMFKKQTEKYFPLPEYDFSGSKVELIITGKVLDKAYASILAKNKELTFHEIIMLDKVQKKKRLKEGEIKWLKSKKLIEGRKPNYFLSKKVAQKTGQKARYSKVKGFDKPYYLDLIKKAIAEHGVLNRKEIDDLLWEKLPDNMNETQKKNKVMNLVSELRRAGEIQNQGSAAKPEWVLVS